jgi:Mitochondrial carrier protein
VGLWADRPSCAPAATQLDADGCRPAAAQIGIIPYAGVDITAFELLKQRLLEEYNGHPPPPAVFGAGMLSSCVAQFVSYPLALVRTRMQVSPCRGFLHWHTELNVCTFTGSQLCLHATYVVIALYGG